MAIKDTPVPVTLVTGGRTAIKVSSQITFSRDHRTQLLGVRSWSSQRYHLVGNICTNSTNAINVLLFFANFIANVSIKIHSFANSVIQITTYISVYMYVYMRLFYLIGRYPTPSAFSNDFSSEVVRRIAFILILH